MKVLIGGFLFPGGLTSLFTFTRNLPSAHRLILTQQGSWWVGLSQPSSQSMACVTCFHVFSHIGLIY